MENFYFCADDMAIAASLVQKQLSAGTPQKYI